MSVSLIDGHIDDDVMTDEQIIKALECCINDDCDNCHDTFGNCEHNAMRNALDLINRQKAEIERLQNILLKFMDEVARWEEKKGIDVSELPLIPICDEGRDAIDHHRAVAIKQFAERLKENVESYDVTTGYKITIVHAVEEETIDNLVKEMVGEASG